MRKSRWHRRPSPAFLIATLALSIALGGTSYAAITVTGAQIRDGSITTRDIRDHTLRTQDFARGSEPALPSAASAGLQSARTQDFARGSQPALASAAAAGLQSGDILAGVFDVRGQAVQAGDTFRTTLPFGHKLPGPPSAVRLLANPGFTTPDCQGWGGDPDPAPGVLCIYVDGTGNQPDVRINFAGVANLVELTGTGLAVRATSPGALSAFGAWAYKVP